MYCDEPTPGGVAICEDCYEQRTYDLVNMECPDCLSKNLVYEASLNMFYCWECEEFIVWKWEIL